MKALFVVPPLAGVVNPFRAIAAEWRSRGHSTIWCSDPRYRADEADATVGDPVPDPVIDTVQHGSVTGLRGAMERMDDGLLPLARWMLPAVESAIHEHRPDVVITDHLAFAGALGARRLGVPYVTVVTSAENIEMMPASLGDAAHKVHAWYRDQRNLLQRECGLDTHADGETSALVAMCTSPQLLGRAPEAANVRCFGPALRAHDDRDDFPWAWLDGRPLVYVATGTIVAASAVRFYTTVVNAVRDLPVQAAVAAPSGVVGEVPDNVKVAPFLPQLALIASASAVVCHGGFNTVCEALAARVPVVVAPSAGDTPLVAAQIVRSDAGIRIGFRRPRTSEIRGAITEVLENPRFRLAAQRVAQEFAACGGIPALVDAVEAVPASR